MGDLLGLVGAAAPEAVGAAEAAAGAVKAAGSAGSAASAAAPAVKAAESAGLINNYYKPFVAGAQQSLPEAWKNMGNNPQTYGYAAKKLEDFSKMAPPLPPTQMASMPGGQPRRMAQPEDSFAQLMRLRRRG